MEEELINLKKELYDLYDNVEGNVWKYINNWKKRFWRSIDKIGSKYSWCEEEFENIHSLNKKNFPKDSFRGCLDSYKNLFRKIKERE